MDFDDLRTAMENGTCKSQFDTDMCLHFSLIPSVLIIMALSFLERRTKRTKFDDKIQLLNRRFGFVVPLDLIGTFENRWTFGFAFGAIANKVMSLFFEQYLPPGTPSWARAFGLLAGAFEVGLSYYPIFACLTTDNKIIGSLTGFLYTLFWFTVTVIDITLCPHGETIGQYEKVIFYWPAVLCFFFLLGRFVHMFIKSIRILLGYDIRNEEKCFLTIHQAEHVKRLFRKPEQVEKNWFEKNIYTWDPNFKFPSRMIGTTVLSVFCLYIFVTMEYSIYLFIINLLTAMEAQIGEAAVDASSETYNSTLASIKEFNSNLVAVWFCTTFLSCAVTVSYIFHILACYRKHMKRLWIGEKGFLPIKFWNPSPIDSVTAIARYTGWQVAYILWGYLILHIVQIMFGMAFVYAVVEPLKSGQALIFLKGLGFTVLTLFFVALVMFLQVVLAGQFFLQKKISPEDKQKPLALNNRKAFHNYNYFFFFYNVILGLSTCLIRLLCSLILGSWLIGRIDRTILQRGYESADMGYKTWIGMIFVDHYHTNPILVCFCNILLVARAEKRLKLLSACDFSNISSGSSLKAKTRWLLFYTLSKNPRLIIQRKLKDMDNTVVQTRLTQASVMEAEIKSNQEKPIDLNNVDIRERH